MSLEEEREGGGRTQADAANASGEKRAGNGEKVPIARVLEMESNPLLMRLAGDDSHGLQRVLHH
jgi:hypothetical protein